MNLDVLQIQSDKSSSLDQPAEKPEIQEPDTVEEMQIDPLITKPGSEITEKPSYSDDLVSKSEQLSAQKLENGHESVCTDEPLEQKEDNGFEKPETHEHVTENESTLDLIESKLVNGSENPPIEQFNDTKLGDKVENQISGLSESTEKAETDKINGSVSGEKETKKKKSKSTPLVTSTRVLRCRTKEQPEIPETNNDVTTENTIEKKKKKKMKKKTNGEAPVDDFSRIRNRLKYMLSRIKCEQHFIDAYSGEGWKGQSLEKIKPENELRRAKSHILRYKLKIRDLFQRVDLLLAEGKLPEALFDDEGEIDSEDIFCAKCGSMDLPENNDIILCDGACERGFHQFCVDPPLLNEDIPPDDEGWLCPGCDCKDDCLDLLNDFYGTRLSIVDSWEKVFPEEAAAALSGKTLDDNVVFPSDDSEDDDYNPGEPELEETKEKDDDSGSDSDSDESGSDSDSDECENVTGVTNLGVFSDGDSEDDDEYDPEAIDDDEQVKPESSSSDFTSDSEDLGVFVNDVAQDQVQTSRDKGKGKGKSLKSELSFLLDNNDNETPVLEKRHVKKFDYKKLHDETYGNVPSEDSSDEDFEESGGGQKRKRKVTNKCSVSENGEDNVKEIEEDDESADDEFDPEASDDESADDDEQMKEESSGDDDNESENEGETSNDKEKLEDSKGKLKGKGKSLKAELSDLLALNEPPVSGKRQVKKFDYKKLHDETFGNIPSDSSDEDFEKASGGQKRKKSKENGKDIIKGEDSKAKEIEHENENSKHKEIEEHTPINKKSGKKSKVEDTNNSSASTSGKRKSFKKLGEVATQKLSEAFKENQYLSRTEKESLAKDAGLTIQQVSKWFENARWSFRHGGGSSSNVGVGPTITTSPPPPSSSNKKKSSDIRHYMISKPAIDNDESTPKSKKGKGKINENSTPKKTPPKNDSKAKKSEKKKGKMEDEDKEASSQGKNVDTIDEGEKESKKRKGETKDQELVEPKSKKRKSEESVEPQVRRSSRRLSGK